MVSYDITLTIDTGGEFPATVCEVGNYTYNVSPMYVKALGCSLSDLHDSNCGESIERLRKAVIEMSEHPADYRALNPSNGWGNYEGALAYLRKLYEGCIQHPKATIDVH